MKISERMRTASIWSVWVFLVIGVLIWTLFRSFEWLGIEDKAGWAGAIGTVLAVLGAGCFPIWHLTHREDRERIRWQCVLLECADTLSSDLNQLIGVLNNVQDDTVSRLEETYPLERWAMQLETLNSIPLTVLSSHQIQIVGECKLAATLSIRFIKKLFEFKSLMTRDPVVIKLNRLWFSKASSKLEGFCSFAAELTHSLRSQPGVRFTG